MEKKTVFLLEQSSPFANFSFLRKLNACYKKSLKAKAIKLAKKTPNSLLIADYEVKVDLKDSNIKCKSFENYIDNTTYDNPYAEASEVMNQWNKLLQTGNYAGYKDYNLTFFVEEMDTYFMIGVLNKIKILNAIIKKESPFKIVVFTKQGLYTRIAKAICQQKNIEFANVPAVANSLLILDPFVKRFTLLSRKHDFPWSIRKEFVKSKNEKHFEKHKVLVGAFSIYYLDRLFSIVQSLSKKVSTLVLATYTDAQTKLDREKIAYATFGDYLERSNLNPDFNHQWAAIKQSSLIIKWVYNNLPIFPIAEEQIRSNFLYNFPELVNYIESVENIFKKEPIKAVLLIDDIIPVDRVILAVAKKKKVPTVIVQHGIAIYPDGRAFFPMLADNFLAWGKVTKDFLLDNGVGKDQVIVTGSSRLDALIKRKPNRGVLGEFEIKKEYVILATQPFDEVFATKEKITLLKNVICAIRKFPQYELIISVHPRDNLDLHKAVIKELNAQDSVKLVQVSQEKVDDLISFAKVFITVNSTMILEAMIIGKPVIAANFFKRPDPALSSEGAFEVTSFKELVSVLSSLDEKMKTFQKHRLKFLQRACYKLDGKSTERIIKLILGVIAKDE